MRVNNISNISFQRRLNRREDKKVNKLHPQVQKLLEHNGDNILIVHDPCLPAAKNKDTGIGYLFSKEGLKYLKDMKTLLGITAVEVHPQGEYYIGGSRRFCCPYSATALSLGSHLIPPAELTKSEYGKLLTADEVQSIISSNTASNKDTILNWENILPSDSQNEKILKKAHERFKSLPDNAGIKQDYKSFIASNNDWLEPISIYEELLKKYQKALKHWNILDQNLYNPDYSNPQKETRLKEILTQNADDIDFYKFKEYLADKFLTKSKEALNNIGLRLTGDQLIGFSEAEVFAYPKAFMKGKTIGWDLPALDYDTILTPDSSAAKLLKRKTELFAKRYDGSIRFDVAWAYLQPAIEDTKTQDIEHRQLNTDALLKMIEDTVKKVRGDKFNPNHLLYEFEADSKDFPLDSTNWRFVNNRVKVYSMQYMDSTWGYTEGFERGQKFAPETVIGGLGNQDVLPLKRFVQFKDTDISKLSKEESINLLWETFGGDKNQLYKEKNYNFYVDRYKEICIKRKAQIEILSKKYNIPAETLYSIPAELAKAKAAEAFAGKNTMFYFMDVLGRAQVFDADRLNSYENYRYRITLNYMDEYTKALADGFGINMFDIYEKRFKQTGLDKKYPKIFKQIQKFKEIIMEPEVQKKSPVKKYVLIAGGVLLIAGLGIAAFISNKKQPVKNKPAEI